MAGVGYVAVVISHTGNKYWTKRTVAARLGASLTAAMCRVNACLDAG